MMAPMMAVVPTAGFTTARITEKLYRTGRKGGFLSYFLLKKTKITKNKMCKEDIFAIFDVF